jgi:hypothetical protein
MEKKSKKKAPQKKRRHTPRAFLIEVGKDKKPTLEDVELAISKKLAAHPTDLFRNTQTVVIVLEDEGHHNPTAKRTE